MANWPIVLIMCLERKNPEARPESFLPARGRPPEALVRRKARGRFEFLGRLEARPDRK